MGAGEFAVTVDDIRAAAKTVEGEVVRTPALPARRLNEATGAEVFLKLENLQYTGSFKDRGAFNKLSRLGPAERRAGVVAASAGNHAQGVAYHAGRLGIPATIVMPKNTPFTKAEATRRFGARIVLAGEDLAEAQDAAMRIVDEEGRVFVHPYDDPAIIAGQGTVALEFLADVPDLDVLVVAIGGGGLISGCAIAAKAINPEIEIIGVEAQLYPSMYQVLHDRPPTSGGQTIAEGIAVKRPGHLTRPIVEALVSEILLLDEAALERGVQTMLESENIVVEGAGGASLAAMQSYPEHFRRRRVGLVVSGGNIDSRLLASVLMRGLVREGRLARFRVEITDAPGVLAEVARLIGETGGNIVEVYHQRLFYDVPVKLAELDIVVETRNRDHVQEIVGALAAAGYRARVLRGTTAAEG